MNVSVVVMFPLYSCILDVSCLLRLLGSLTCCLCDAAVNLPSQEVRPAESFAQLLMFYLNSKSALQRIAVALIFCQWAEHSKV